MCTLSNGNVHQVIQWREGRGKKKRTRRWKTKQNKKENESTASCGEKKLEKGNSHTSTITYCRHISEHGRSVLVYEHNSCKKKKRKLKPAAVVFVPCSLSLHFFFGKDAYVTWTKVKCGTATRTYDYILCMIVFRLLFSHLQLTLMCQNRLQHNRYKKNGQQKKSEEEQKKNAKTLLYMCFIFFHFPIYKKKAHTHTHTNMQQEKPGESSQANTKPLPPRKICGDLLVLLFTHYTQLSHPLTLSLRTASELRRTAVDDSERGWRIRSSTRSARRARHAALKKRGRWRRLHSRGCARSTRCSRHCAAVEWTWRPSRRPPPRVWWVDCSPASRPAASVETAGSPAAHAACYCRGLTPPVLSAATSPAAATLRGCCSA